MNPIQLQQYPDPETLARAVAAQWADHRRSASPAEHYVVALSGGRIAATFFRELRALPAPLFDEVDFFWADERCVAPDHSESNFRLAGRELFEPLKIPPSRVHRIHGEDPPEAAVEQAARELRQVTGTTTVELPALDLVFLGMGEDGHIASLFPGGTVVQGNGPDPVYLAVSSPKPPPQRITLSYQALSRAREAWVLASGPGKEKALSDSLKPDGQTPLARLIAMRGLTRIFTNVNFRR